MGGPLRAAEHGRQVAQQLDAEAANRLGWHRRADPLAGGVGLGLLPGQLCLPAGQLRLLPRKLLCLLGLGIGLPLGLVLGLLPRLLLGRPLGLGLSRLPRLLLGLLLGFGLI